jgi:hypothetical protein
MRPSKPSLLVRAATAVAAAFAATAALAGNASAAPEAGEPFKATHTDRCLSSHTAGELEWRSLSPTPTPVLPFAVGVTGEVALRNATTCVFPSTPTAVAVFTAYNGPMVVDSERRSTTGVTRFEFVLAQANSPTPPTLRIDRVTVQVCHTAGTSDPTAAPFTCGAITTYTP